MYDVAVKMFAFKILVFLRLLASSRHVFFFFSLLACSMMIMMTWEVGNWDSEFPIRSKFNSNRLNRSSGKLGTLPKSGTVTTVTKSNR